MNALNEESETLEDCEPKAVPTFSLNLSKILGDVL